MPMSQRKPNPSRLLFYRPPANIAEERLAAARDKAAEYHNHEAAPADGEQVEKKEVRTLDSWGDLVSQRIEEAIRRGEFDNLPGRGKPIDVQPDPFVPQDRQMAYRLLKNNDMAPGWITERKEVLKLKERFSQQLQTIAEEARAQWAAAQDEARREQVMNRWARWLVRWEGEIVEINRRIQTLNLKQPVTHLEVLKLRLDDELRRAGATRILG
jgi:DnaJ family protein C protein 28